MNNQACAEERSIRLNFGKYKDKSTDEIPYSYEFWCYNNIMSWLKKISL